MSSNAVPVAAEAGESPALRAGAGLMGLGALLAGKAITERGA